MFDEITTVLPPHSTDFERALEQASLWVVENSAIPRIWDTQLCPEDLLPWLAWSLSVDYWNPEWSADQKRDVVKRSINIHRKKGTVGAVKSAIAGFGYASEISEWFEYGGEAHTFRIDVLVEKVLEAGLSVSPELAAEVRRVIYRVKPVRSHYDLRLGDRLKVTSHVRTGYRQFGKDVTPRGVTPPTFTINATARAGTGYRERAFDRATFTPIERSAA